MKFIFLLFLLLLPSLVFAQYSLDPNQETESFMEDSLEDSREAIAETLFGLTDYIDTALDDIRTEEHRQEDWFRVGVETKFRSGSAIDIGQRFRARINLKPFGERFQLVIEGSNTDTIERDSQRDQTQEETLGRLSGESGFVGLRYPFMEAKKWTMQAEAGLTIKGGVTPIAGLRTAYRTALAEKTVWDPSLFVFWDQDEGNGQRTRSDINFLLNTHSFIRSRIEGYYSEESKGLEHHKEFSYFYELKQHHVFGATLGAFAYTKPNWKMDTVRTSLRYRYPLWEDWLFLETEPGIEFPEDRDYKRTPFIVFRIDMLIDRDSRLGI